MKRLSQKPTDKKIFSCPQCDKRRMIRPVGYVVSLDKKTHKDKTGRDIDLFVDICDTCYNRNYKTYFEPTKADIRKILKTMQEDAKLADQSLEDLL